MDYAVAVHVFSHGLRSSGPVHVFVMYFFKGTVYNYVDDNDDHEDNNHNGNDRDLKIVFFNGKL